MFILMSYSMNITDNEVILFEETPLSSIVVYVFYVFRI